MAVLEAEVTARPRQTAGIGGLRGHRRPVRANELDRVALRVSDGMRVPEPNAHPDEGERGEQRRQVAT